MLIFLTNWSSTTHNWTAVRLTKEYKASAPLAVRAIWKRLREALPRYGLGRSEFLPMRKGSEALSVYVGKYLEAGLLIRRHDCKGTATAFPSSVPGAAG
jgi:hypothetical protein